jgi:hypothetical protein
MFSFLHAANQASVTQLPCRKNHFLMKFADLAVKLAIFDPEVSGESCTSLSVVKLNPAITYIIAIEIAIRRRR